MLQCVGVGKRFIYADKIVLSIMSLGEIQLLAILIAGCLVMLYGLYTVFNLGSFVANALRK
ncbi:hypothetical protein Halru_2414 [Halovivax ruber XH-70]|uniref:Uncharacterized protein n=1 Tax=Halovivax ruber (strain DSM 18193 / JCM 13892 / XH-70) TaxID=797302 RepID=L0IG88_HALRX|nr:hypothetical protein Halru_2414 [Halovivax ruber XH-70]